MSSEKSDPPSPRGLGRFFRRASRKSDSGDENETAPTSGPTKWSMGVLNDKLTVEVPGSVLLLAAHRNEPLGLRNINARTSHSSIPAGFAVDAPMTPGGTRRLSTGEHGHAPVPVVEESVRKTTDDGAIILEPQPEDSANDPLNWPRWQRDAALFSLGFYCMLGGGMTPVIAAGFTDVAKEFDVEVERVALTTGLFMMGMGVGSVIFSPTAILWGKRPVYLASSIIFIATSLWAAWSPNFGSLVAARVFQGIAVSPVECLPSATIAEIYFLHERAYRIGIYTLLLLGGKNLIPLVSAAIIGRLGWRWTFWIVAMVVAFGGALLFLFVPETFWDRAPHPKSKKPSKRPSFMRRISSRHAVPTVGAPAPPAADTPVPETPAAQTPHARHRDVHVGFAPEVEEKENMSKMNSPRHSGEMQRSSHVGFAEASDAEKGVQGHQDDVTFEQVDVGRGIPTIRFPPETAKEAEDRPASARTAHKSNAVSPMSHANDANVDYFNRGPVLAQENISASQLRGPPKVQAYTHNLRYKPAKTFTQRLRPYNGRLNNDKWFKVMLRPFVLFSYPAVLWSSIVYACSVGWLIVISESMAMIYRDPKSYNFTALQTGLVYLSPFIGGILGTGVAGKISDIIVKAMARRNGGLYEPEFRLVMAIPILVTTCIGLMGFGWSAEQKDHWMVPTFFFGVISFGCCLGSTTAITFCVDSYRQYAGEALVTLNFSKNILHGLIFSLFVTHWLAGDGPKMVYIWIGIIQLVLLLFTIPLFIYGKRLRMWTVRKNMMEKF